MVVHTSSDEALSTVGTNTQEDLDKFGCVVQGHFQRKFNELGKSSLVVEYDQKENMNTAGDGDTATGVGVTLHQAIDAAAMEVWVKYSTLISIAKVSTLMISMSSLWERA